MNREVLRTRKLLWLACVLGLLVAASGCEDSKQPQAPAPTAEKEPSRGGLVAGGNVSTSSRYVLISTTSPVSAGTDRPTQAEEEAQ